MKFRLFKTKPSQLDELAKAKVKALDAVKAAKDTAVEDIRKAASQARKGITCDKCGANVYTKNWVHGMNGKAFCLEVCWPQAVEGR